jgi:capsular polysaccharide biosynthesis protein
LRNLSVGNWNLEEASLSEGLDDKVSPRKYVISKTRTALRPALADYVDPSQRGLVDALVVPRQVVVEGVNMLFFPNANLFGSRFVASEDGGLYTDYELTQAQLDLVVEGKGDVKSSEHQITKADGVYRSAALEVAPITLEGPHILLTSSEPINFGAWLIRVLPKIHYLKRIGAFELGNYICYIDREWQKSLLSWMGIPNEKVVQQVFGSHFKVDKLLVPTWPNRTKFLDDGTLEFLADARATALRRDEVSTGKAIYVSRLGWNKALDARIARKPGALRMRPFDQEQELANRLAQLGVESFSPEEHSFEETIRVFATAPLVVGPQGAGLFNAIFCKPGTPVIEIAHLPYFTHGHASIFLSCGHRYMVVVGEDPELGMEGAHPIHRALKIDVEKTVDFVARQLDSLQ